MTPFVAALVLASAALHPLWNLLIKRNASPVGAYLGLAGTLVGLALLHALWSGAPLWPPAGAWGLLAVSAAGQGLYGVALVTVLRRGDLSAYYPVVRASPIAIVAYGWLVQGATYGWPMLAGILLVLAGGYRLQAGSGRRLDDPVALGAAVLAMMGAAVYSVADGIAMRSMAPEVLLFWTQLAALPLLLAGFRAVGQAVPLRPPSRIPWVALGAGALSYGSYYLILLAYQMGAPVAAVASVRQASIPLSVLIGALWLGEKRLAGRLGASLLVAAGIVLIILNR
ncbi:DMT family transporter [Azospirillum isscasi]|uniref:DMT family transporter n=1 Tax=Azospirillum isscasi TaxID=3053926 RepID=A0ABU0WHB5_9PROT|nr:DMT family transporter [Azospirillum isscasi]MDQ2103602.1 DMT family transporter [Azospirillum isscasi]